MLNKQKKPEELMTKKEELSNRPFVSIKRNLCMAGY